MDPKPPPQTRAPSLGAKIASVMAIMGAASVVSIFIGIVRLKLIAVLLGPAGVGLYGIFLGVQNAGVAVFGLGFNSSGIRQVANAAKNSAQLSDIRWALSAGNLLLGLLACGMIWLSAGWIAALIFPEANHRAEIALLGIGVLAALLAGGRWAVLQGLRRTGAVAGSNILGALLATASGLWIVYQCGMAGMVAVVIAMPVASLVAVWVIGARTLPPMGQLTPRHLPPIWRESSTLGLTFMGTASINALSVIAIQAIILRAASAAEVGLFQAVFALSVHYIGFLFLASQSDFYPRIVAVADRPRRLCFLVNKQTEIGLLFAAPILITIAALSDWILPLLYSASFSQAVGLQRLWLLGDILTIPTLFCAYVLVAKNRGGWFFWTKLLGGLIYVGAVYLGYAYGAGLMGLAIAKVATEVLVLVLTTVVVAQQTGFFWRRKNVMFAGAIGLSVASIAGMALIHPLLANVVGLGLAAVFAWVALVRIYGKARLFGGGKALK